LQDNSPAADSAELGQAIRFIGTACVNLSAGREESHAGYERLRQIVKARIARCERFLELVEG